MNNTTEMLLFKSQPSSSSTAVPKEASVVENGVEDKPSKGDAEDVVDANSEEVTTANVDEVDAERVEKRKSPELPLPGIPLPELPTPEAPAPTPDVTMLSVQDGKENVTDDEGQLTPSGTLSRTGTLDE